MKEISLLMYSKYFRLGQYCLVPPF